MHPIVTANQIELKKIASKIQIRKYVCKWLAAWRVVEVAGIKRSACYRNAYALWGADDSKVCITRIVYIYLHTMNVYDLAEVESDAWINAKPSNIWARPGRCFRNVPILV